MSQLAKFIKKISFCREPDEEQEFYEPKKDCDCENKKVIITILESDLDEVRKELDYVQNERQKLTEDLSLNISYIRAAASTETLEIKEQPVIECSICYENMLDENCHQIVLTPCGHTCCNKCAPRLTDCHQCRSEIESKIRVFYTGSEF